MLKSVISSLDDVPEELQEHYEQKGDEYVLKVDGMAPKSRLDEFRENNIKLMKEAEQLKSKLASFKDLDPEEYKKMKARLEEIEDQKLIDEGNLEEVVEQRTERMRKTFEDRIKALEEARDREKERADGTSARLSDLLIDSQLRDVASQNGVRSSAVSDILLRGQKIWRLNEEGEAVPMKEDGSIIYGEDGSKPLGMEEWVKGLQKDAPHLFEGSSGGGAPRGGNQGPPQSGSVSIRDQQALNNNLEGLAKGEVSVGK